MDDLPLEACALLLVMHIGGIGVFLEEVGLFGFGMLHDDPAL